MSAQDGGVVEPRVRLRLILALLRILAGRRGHAAVSWHGAGFTYYLSVLREPGDDLLVELDDDPTVIDREEIRERIRDRLRIQP